MAQKMGWDGEGTSPYEYHYERGLYYHEILPNMFCGTMPRNTSDLVRSKATPLCMKHAVSLCTNADMHQPGYATFAALTERP